VLLSVVEIDKDQGGIGNLFAGAGGLIACVNEINLVFVL
jgi:hypothetical protein